MTCLLALSAPAWLALVLAAFQAATPGLPAGGTFATFRSRGRL